MRLWDPDRYAEVVQLGFGSPVTALAWGQRGVAVGTGSGKVALLAVIDRDQS